MPTLDFKGKPFVYSHHLSVPFRELVVDGKKSLVPKGQEPSLDDNLIIHGDNLEALKALLPRYAGQVDVVYIDPPYNTGNEGWAYNDNVNSPLMREWLGKVVDKEDLERHDKWLCMMWPRLELLKELLSATGVIFVSIDSNEQPYLSALMDEIFGREKHVATNVWQKRYSRENREAIGDVHEYILVYANDPSDFKEVRNLVAATDEQLNVYRNPNSDPKGDWRPIPMTAQAGHATKEQFYPIKAPGGKIHTPPEGRCWGIAKATYEKLLKEGRIYFGQDNNSQPNIIRYKSEVNGFVPWTWWPSDEVGHTDEAKKEIYSITGRAAAFDTPKPLRLMKRIIDIATQSDSIVLDSFAGTGTTAHAVLEKNNEDGGHRKFILVECSDEARTLTGQRIEAAIAGYTVQEGVRQELFRKNITLGSLSKANEILAEADNVERENKNRFEKVEKRLAKGVLRVYGLSAKGTEVAGIEGNFTFCTLGAPIDLEGFFDGKSAPQWDQVARYVAYTATGQTLDKVPKKPGKDWLAGQAGGYRIHLIYKPDLDFMRSNDAALDMKLAEKISKAAEGKPTLVYAAAKFMSQKELYRLGLTFCQLPYAIHRILGDAPDEA